MGGASLPQGSLLSGQNPTSSYGQGFLTGNMMMPTGSTMGNNTGLNTAQNQQAQGNAGSNITNSAATQLTQPYSTFSS